MVNQPHPAEAAAARDRAAAFAAWVAENLGALRAEYEIRHLDGDNQNPHAENLAWGTQKDNAADREAHGRTSRGERHSMAIKAGLEARRG